MNLNKLAFLFTFFLSLLVLFEHALAASATVLKAKKEAEAKGYIFFATHDEIVAGAKKEGRLRVITGLESPNFQPLIKGFKKNHPFITDVQIEEIPGSPEAHQKVLLEIKAGQAQRWDITDTYLDFVAAYIPLMMKHDILGMAQHGVLKIDPRMVYPVERNLVSPTTVLTVVPYNKKLISEDKVPTKREDLLKPEFKGKKFVLDIRPVQVAGLVPAWGLEKTLDFARKLAAQEPVWGRGATRMTTAVAAGEYSVYVASNFGSINRAMRKDPTGNLSYKIFEPAPARVVNHANGILKTAAHPHAALLWHEFLASPEGQAIIDKYEPLKGSVFNPSSTLARVTRGKELSIVGWDHFTNFERYSTQIVEAFGFPKADKR